MHWLHVRRQKPPAVIQLSVHCRQGRGKALDTVHGWQVKASRCRRQGASLHTLTLPQPFCWSQVKPSGVGRSTQGGTAGPDGGTCSRRLAPAAPPDSPAHRGTDTHRISKEKGRQASRCSRAMRRQRTNDGRSEGKAGERQRREEHTGERCSSGARHGLLLLLCVCVACSLLGGVREGRAPRVNVVGRIVCSRASVYPCNE